MGTGTVTDGGALRVDREEFRRLLDETMAAVDADEQAGPLLRAAGLRLRLRFPDQGLVLNVASADDPSHHVRWGFDEDPGWEPRLEMTMDSQVANAYLQGKESLAIAIARRRARCRGDAHCALLYVPALKLIVDAYRRRVREDHPGLALA